MIDPADAALELALADLDHAEAAVHAAQVRQQLAARPGLAYAAIDDLGTWNGQTIGELHHDPADSWLVGWTAHTNDTDEPFGPYRTPRLAATALLDTHHPGRT